MSKKGGWCFVIAVLLSFAVSTSVVALEPEESGDNRLEPEETVTVMEDSVYSSLHALPTDQYCGYYFDDNDQLVINVADENAMSQRISFLPDNVPVCYRKVPYSWEDIENAKEELFSRGEELKINGVGFDIVNNAVSVFLEDNAEATKEKIRAVCPIDNITFFDAAENVLLEYDETEPDIPLMASEPEESDDNHTVTVTEDDGLSFLHDLPVVRIVVMTSMIMLNLLSM